MARQPLPIVKPVAVTIAGSDSGGGAGIQADLKAMEAAGVFGTSVITSVTAQNTLGVESTHVLPTEEIVAQYDAVMSDFDVGAMKTGMLATTEIVEAVTERVQSLDVPLVVDPVMVAASGDRLLEEAAVPAYRELFADATIVTPNVDEAAVLTDIEVTNQSMAVNAGNMILDHGADAALIKGGHLQTNPVEDVLVTPDGVEVFTHPYIQTDATHGSGCMLAATIAAHLAHGTDLADAVSLGVNSLSRAIRYHLDVGAGPGSVHHLATLRERADRSNTIETVVALVEWAVETDLTALVPEVGMNIVGATSYAESPAETAAVEGRITRTMSGINPNRGVRLGASSHVARFLLATREIDPTLRFALNCRFNPQIETSLDELGWLVAEYDRSEQPHEVEQKEGRTMGWGAQRAMESVDETPQAIIDRGAVGKESITMLVSTKSESLRANVHALLTSFRDKSN